METFFKFGLFGKEVLKWLAIGPNEPRGIVFLVGAIIFVLLMAGLWGTSKLLTLLLIIVFGVLFGFTTAGGVLAFTVILGQFFNRGSKSKRMVIRNTSTAKQYNHRNKMFHEGEKEKAILDVIMDNYRLCKKMYSTKGNKPVVIKNPWRLAHRMYIKNEYKKRLAKAGIKCEETDYEKVYVIWKNAKKNGYKLNSPWLDIIEADYYYFFGKSLPSDSPIYENTTEEEPLQRMWYTLFENPEDIPEVKAIMKEFDRRAKGRPSIAVKGRR